VTPSRLNSTGLGSTMTGLVKPSAIDCSGVYLDMTKPGSSGSPNSLNVLRLLSSIAVPVAPKKRALGTASRHALPKLPSCERCASSTSTMMLDRSFRCPASANLCTVVMMTPLSSRLSIRCSCAFESGVSTRGIPVVLNSSAVWRTRSLRSAITMMVGFPTFGSPSRHAEAKAISSVLPEPWWCQIRPPAPPANTLA